MRRESAWTVGSGCQTGHSRHYPRIEDQDARDQQGPLQGDKFLEEQVAGPCEFRNFTKFVVLIPDKPLSFSNLCWRFICFSLWPNGMLRIDRETNGDVVFTLSGRIDKEHIAELEALIKAEGKDRRIILDLKELTLTGQNGMAFLAQCEAAGIALANCDPYLREWIARQRTGSQQNRGTTAFIED
jgi:hypothetical protein